MLAGEGRQNQADRVRVHRPFRTDRPSFPEPEGYCGIPFASNDSDGAGGGKKKESRGRPFRPRLSAGKRGLEDCEGCRKRVQNHRMDAWNEHKVTTAKWTDRAS